MKLQFLSFAVVGALGFLVDATALQLFLNVAGLDLYSARIGSFLVAVTFTWAMNRHFTFASDDPRLLREWFRFLSANSLGAGVNLGTYGILVWAIPIVAAHPVLGVAAGSIAGLAVNFLGSRFFVFRDVSGGDTGNRRPLDLSGVPWRPGGAQAFEFWLLAAGAVYALLCLSPSSYAISFQALALDPVGLFLGKARPIRSDEYAVWTPYIQIAVNNGFARFNETSPYLEDLRNFNALPLRDWGLIFKPQFWGFFVLDPAWAYSLHHAIFIVAFLAGWRRLFHLLGFGWSEATLAAFVVFFFPYTQLWWTTTGSLLAGFPWLIVCLFWQTAVWKRVLVLSWLSASWLISHLYPPIVVTCAFAGVVLLLAFRARETLRPSIILPGLLGAALGAAIAVFYLQDAFLVMSKTVYPGDRSIDGGQLSFWQWVSTFLPGLGTTGREPIVSTRNYLETVAGGSFLLAGCFLFCRWRSLKDLALSSDNAVRTARRRLLVLFAGTAVMSVWLLVPLPSEAGAVLLWDKFLAPRFVFALGLLSLSMAMLLAERLDFSVTPARLGVAALLLAGLYGGFRFSYQSQPDFDGLEVWGPILFLLVLGGESLLFRMRAFPAMLAASACAGALVYGTYNPLQSSYPIFHRPDHPGAEAFRSYQEANPENLLLIREVPGSILNAWGYRSVQHVLVSPQLEFFRERFPKLPEKQFNRIFNRYAHIQLTDEPIPYVPMPAPGVIQHDVIRVPMVAFEAGGSSVSTGGGRNGRDVAGLEIIEIAPRGVPLPDGVVDDVTWDEAARTMTLRGWARFSMLDPDNRLLVLAPGAESATQPEPVYRPDVVFALGNDQRLAFSGFTTTVHFGDGKGKPDTVCIWSRDSDQRLFRLGGAVKNWSGGACEPKAGAN
ncbi:GtrA family protein [Nisaea acidiphila]|uniref:GtrA family protein n=1 Tax=Nisaea acidiphila TaxID=1862145 RepID=A0A9J7AVZ1_9PROT|nr:GtrA family protein [Nisaea acidiphila]UUX49597.1 GtrA family protein [Nisaea acidiphila]